MTGVAIDQESERTSTPPSLTGFLSGREAGRLAGGAREAMKENQVHPLKGITRPSSLSSSTFFEMHVPRCNPRWRRAVKGERFHFRSRREPYEPKLKVAYSPRLPRGSSLYPLLTPSPPEVYLCNRVDEWGQ